MSVALAEWGPTLLLLDNAEHVLDSARWVVGGLLDAVPQLRVLATSRRRLDLPDEHSHELRPMAPKDALELFCRRARPRISPTEWEAGEREDVATLVAALDCLPLAIELAAARSRLLPPRALLGRMSDRFALLRSSRRDRHAALRTCIAWSWELLDPAEQSVLAQLSVFHGVWMDSVEAVVRPSASGPVWVIDIVGSLVEHSLVAAELHHGRPRLWLLESIREYAAERLAADPEAERRTRQAYAAHYAEDRRFLRSPHPADVARADLANYRAAVDHALEAGRGSWVLGAFENAAWADAHVGPGARVLTEAEGLLDHPLFAEASEIQRWRLLRRVFTANRRLGRLARAEALLPDFYRLAPPARGTFVRARHALLLRNLGRYDESLRLYREVVQRARNERSRNLASRIDSLAVSTALARSVEEALPLFRQAYDQAIRDRLGRAIGIIRVNLCQALFETGRVHDADALLASPLPSEGVVPVRDVGGEQTLLGKIRLHQGRLDEAAAAFETAYARHRRVGLRLHQADNAGGLGAVLAARGDADAARRRFEEALRLAPTHDEADSWRAASAALDGDPSVPNPRPTG